MENQNFDERIADFDFVVKKLVQEKNGFSYEGITVEAEDIKRIYENKLHFLFNGFEEKGKWCKKLVILMKATIGFSDLSFDNKEDLEQKREIYKKLVTQILSQNKEENEENSSFIGFLAFFTLFQSFRKEVFLGSSFINLDAKKALDQNYKEKLQVQKKELKISDFSFFSSLDWPEFFTLSCVEQISHRKLKEEKFIKKRSKFIIDELSVDSEDFMKPLPYSSLFFFLKALLECIGNGKEIEIWKIRLNFLHNSFLSNPSATLKMNSLSKFQSFLKDFEGKFSARVKFSLLVEYSYQCLFYYKYEASLQALNEAKVLKFWFNSENSWH